MHSYYCILNIAVKVGKASNRCPHLATSSYEQLGIKKTVTAICDCKTATINNKKKNRLDNT